MEQNNNNNTKSNDFSKHNNFERRGVGSNPSPKSVSPGAPGSSKPKQDKQREENK